MLPVKRFIDFIEQNSLFTQSSQLLVALSGGMDSVLMVHFLKAAGYPFAIAHCNFQLRGSESLADQLFCHQLALKLQVPFHSIQFDTKKYAHDNKISIQMAARDLRYQWFEQIRQQHGYDWIALAHHQNDTIETILLNLVRGTRIAGLHGILPKNGFLARPMLCFNRQEIQTIIADEGISYVEDSSNASAKYARNKIRHEVIPKLKELNPSLENTFERNLRHFKALEILLEQKLAQLKATLFVHKHEEIYIPIHEVIKLEPQFLLLYGLLQDYGFNESTVDDIIASLNKHPGRIFESPGYTLVLDREALILKKRSAVTFDEIFIEQGDSEAVFGKYRLTILQDDSALVVKGNPMAASVDAALLQFPLTVRHWRQSDFFYPLGMKARKKLSDFFINQKIPLPDKEEIPLLVNANGDIIWIGGYRLDNRYKVSHQTKKVRIFELHKL